MTIPWVEKGIKRIDTNKFVVYGFYIHSGSAQIHQVCIVVGKYGTVFVPVRSTNENNVVIKLTDVKLDGLRVIYSNLIPRITYTGGNKNSFIAQLIESFSPKR